MLIFAANTLNLISEYSQAGY